MGSKYIRDGILRTLSYADIFDYPLTVNEIWCFFIGDTSVSKASVVKEVKNMPGLIFHNGFYCFKDRKQIISRRINLEKYAKEKYIIAKKICSILSFLPTILLIGISGGLAMNNVNNNDDIDLFVIVRNDTLWSTRLVVLLLLGIMGVRRSKDAVDVANKICVNMIITEKGMAVAKKKRNLFTAHEVWQMKPLFVRDSTYELFLVANMWIVGFLPNASVRIKNEELRIMGNPKSPLFIIHYSIFILLEFIAKKVQFWYMKKHITSEVVSDTILAFHPNDYMTMVLKKYQKKIKQYEKI